VARHRGKSPRQAAYFFNNPERTFQAAQLASLYLLFGLLYGDKHGVRGSYRLGSCDSGALLCRVYEAYRELHAPAPISFEHAWFLLIAIARCEQIGLSRCQACGGVRVHDLLARHRLACVNCSAEGFLATAVREVVPLEIVLTDYCGQQPVEPALGASQPAPSLN
jgi:hypothetical protein